MVRLIERLPSAMALTVLDKDINKIINIIQPKYFKNPLIQRLTLIITIGLQSFKNALFQFSVKYPNLLR